MPIYLAPNNSRLSSEISSLSESVEAKLDSMSRKMSKKVSKYQYKKSLLNCSPKAINLKRNFNVLCTHTTTKCSNNLNKKFIIPNYPQNYNERLRAGKSSNSKNNKITKSQNQDNKTNEEGLKANNLPNFDSTKRDLCNLTLVEKANFKEGVNALASKQLNELLFSIFSNRYPYSLKRMKTYQSFWTKLINQMLNNGNSCIYKQYIIPYYNDEVLADCIKIINEKYPHQDPKQENSVLQTVELQYLQAISHGF